jgi:hypothetical protein
MSEYKTKRRNSNMEREEERERRRKKNSITFKLGGIKENQSTMERRERVIREIDRERAK